jgi:hypothetical protein
VTEVTVANVANVDRLHLVAVEVEEAATVNAPVARAGVAVAVTRMDEMKERVEKSAGGEAGLPQLGRVGGACHLIGGGTTEPEPLLWMTAQK